MQHRQLSPISRIVRRVIRQVDHQTDRGGAKNAIPARVAAAAAYQQNYPLLSGAPPAAWRQANVVHSKDRRFAAYTIQPLRIITTIRPFRSVDGSVRRPSPRLLQSLAGTRSGRTRAPLGNSLHPRNVYETIQSASVSF